MARATFNHTCVVEFIRLPAFSYVTLRALTGEMLRIKLLARQPAWICQGVVFLSRNGA